MSPMPGAVDAAMGRLHAKEALKRCEAERRCYKRERDDLLAALFQSYETRKHLAEAILDGDPDALPERSPIETDPRQGE